MKDELVVDWWVFLELVKLRQFHIICPKRNSLKNLQLQINVILYSYTVNISHIIARDIFLQSSI